LEDVGEPIRFREFNELRLERSESAASLEDVLAGSETGTEN